MADADQTATPPPVRPILVVDDDAQLRDLMRRMLELGGFEAVEAGDGDEALKRLRQQPVSLVITDILMPNREGLETIIELRRLQPEVPIIAMSGGGADNYLLTASKLGAVRTLAKPFSRHELIAMVNEVLGSTAAQ